MKLKFTSIERELLDPGFLRVYHPNQDMAHTPSVLPERSNLAKVKKGDRFKPRQVRVCCQVSSPPDMTEGALIHAMQSHGIGRPSTYAPTIATLIQRGYATRSEQGVLASTSLGRQVCDYLINRFPDLFSLDFTAQMEAQLDALATRRATYEAVLQSFWAKLPGQKGK